FDLFTAEVMGDAKTQFSAQTVIGHLKSLADSNNDPDLMRLADELPKSLGVVIKKALQRHPKHRYQGALQFDEALVTVERALLTKRPFAPGQSCGPYTIVNLI